MERGQLPSRTTVARLLGRTLSLALAVFAMAGAGTFFLSFADRHDDSSDLFPFGGWQVYLAALAIAVIGFALFVIGSLGMRRHRLPPETPRSYQALAAFIAIILGGSVAQAFHHQPERAYNWAAGYTAGAKHEKAQDAAVEREMLGDATHPPQPFGPDGVVPFPAAPAFVASALLRVSDLGADWYAESPPRGGATDPLHNIYDIAGLQGTGRCTLAQEKWDGMLWVQNVVVSEDERKFVTPTTARRFVVGQIRSLRASSPTPPELLRRQIAGVPAWEETLSGGGFTDHIAFVSVGDLAIDMHVTPELRNLGSALRGPRPSFPAVTDRQILRAAIERAEAATDSN
jgi:hypothetical protein